MRRLLPVLALALALAAPGCGGGGRSARAAAAGEASKSPRAILADAAAAMRGVRSYHIEGSQSDTGGPLSISGDVARGGRVQLSVRKQGLGADVRILGRDIYMRASRAFWLRHLPSAAPRSQAIASLLAGRWIKPPASAAGDLEQIARQSEPAATAHCLFHGIGTLGKGGTVTVGGKPAVIVTSKADRPGATAGAIYVSVAAPHLPLRAVETGRRRPGGTFDPLCDSRRGSTPVQSDLRLSRFDEPVRIAAPPSVLDLSTLGQASGAA